jgi:uncharacterized protein YcbK (DUF882 family)
VISLKELNKRKFATTEKIDTNLKELQRRLNIIRAAYGIPMIVTSGLRDIEHHKSIYRRKGIEEENIPMGSKHLHGQAADIYDPEQKLQKWCLENEALLEKAGLYCEHFSVTLTWVHFQSVPPRSGNRFFYP